MSRATFSRAMRNIERLEGRLREAAEAGLRATVAEFDRRVRERTPLRTGAARANWKIGIGAPDLSGDALFTDVAAGRQAALDQLQRPLLGTKIWLTNALSYVRYLEYGSSPQAPAGMLRLTLAELPTLARTVGRAAFQAVMQGRTPTPPGPVSGTPGGAPSRAAGRRARAMVAVLRRDNRARARQAAEQRAAGEG